MMRLNSIRARMTLGFTAGIASLMLLACGGLIAYSRHAAARGADMLLNATARRVAVELSTTGQQDEAGNQQGETDSQQGETDGPHGAGEGQQSEAEGQNTDKDNADAQSNAQHVDLPELIDQERQELQASNLAMLIVDGRGRIAQKSQERVPAWPRAADDSWRMVTVPCGADTVVIGLPWEKTAEALRSQAIVLLLLCSFGILVAAAGSWLLVGHTLSPISSLSRQARSASAESLRVLLKSPSQDAEVVELVGTLNALLGRLAETAASKGRFYAAASHELRTPLQALSGHLELALDRERSREEYRATVIEAHQQTKRLISLVRALLVLNQLDSGLSQPPREPVNLTEVCERIRSSLSPLIAQRRLRVRTELRPETMAAAPPGHAEMLVRNLVENAVKYATEGGIVAVELAERAGAPKLVLFNEAVFQPGLRAEQLFEPFYRPDASRSSGTGGNGVGLAIGKAIADANGWRLAWRQETGGVRVTVTFGPPGPGRG